MQLALASSLAAVLICDTADNVSRPCNSSRNSRRHKNVKTEAVVPHGPAFAITEFATDSPLESAGFEPPVPERGFRCGTMSAAACAGSGMPPES